MSERNIKIDADRYNFLRCGGYEVLQDEKYWKNVDSFDDAVDKARTDCLITGSITAKLSNEGQS